MNVSAELFAVFFLYIDDGCICDAPTAFRPKETDSDCSLLTGQRSLSLASEKVRVAIDIVCNGRCESHTTCLRSVCVTYFEFKEVH